MSSRVAPSPSVEGQIIGTCPWGDFVFDSVVKVADPFWGKRNRIKWWFRRHVVNAATGAEWVEVYGGQPGHYMVHSFKADAVTLVPIRKPRRRRSS